MIVNSSLTSIIVALLFAASGLLMIPFCHDCQCNAKGRCDAH
jgi:hypothetical protein